MIGLYHQPVVKTTQAAGVSHCPNILSPSQQPLREERQDFIIREEFPVEIYKTFCESVTSNIELIGEAPGSNTFRWTCRMSHHHSRIPAFLTTDVHEIIQVV